MKTLKFKFNASVFLLILSTAVLVSCSDNDDDNAQQSITDEEVTEVMKSSLVDQGGLVFDINFMSSSLGSMTSGRPTSASANITDGDLSAANCNQTVTQSNSNSNTVGPRSWTITSNWSWTLNCDAQNNSASFDLIGNGTLDFDGPNLSKDITRAHNFNITGIEPSSDDWIYNANHTRNGLIQSNVGNKNSMTTTLNYGSTDIVVSKATQEIVSGTFNVSFQATLSNGNTVTRGATVVFNGNRTATVTLDNGTTFDVSW
jgi:hypothetical protein